MAASAIRGRLARARFPGGIIALDYFGDTDLEPMSGGARAGIDQGPTSSGERAGAPWPVRVLSVSGDLGLPRTAAGLGRAALLTAEPGHDVGRWSGVAFTGGIETRPGLVRLLAARGDIIGCGASAMAAVRDPLRLFPFLAARSIAHAATLFDATVPDDGRAWFCKRRRSAGGAGVRAVLAGEGRRPGEHIQERIAGRPGSAVILSSREGTNLLGVSEQIDGACWPGAGPFRYAGSIAGPRGALLDDAATEAMAGGADAIAREFGLLGLWGLDFVVDAGGVPRVIEINPRWTASMELFDAQAGESLFDLHAAAIEGGAGNPTIRHPARFIAKGVLYATGDVTAPDPARLAAIGAADRPRAGEWFHQGQPVCTVFSEGPTRDACLAALSGCAEHARRLLEPPAAADVVSCERTQEPTREGTWPQPARPW